MWDKDCCHSKDRVLPNVTSGTNYVIPGDMKSKTCTIRQNTLVFNAFVFCQFWNEINCRKLKEINVLEKFFDSYMFTAVLIFTFFLQAIMVEAAGAFAGTNGLDAVQWLICIVIGLFSLPVGLLARFTPIAGLEAKFDYGKDVGDDELAEEEDDEDEPTDINESSSTVITAGATPNSENITAGSDAKPATTATVTPLPGVVE